MPDEERVLVRPFGEGLARVEIRFGFMDEPNIPEALAVAMARGRFEPFDLNRLIYYTGHETIIPSGRRPGLPRWREAIFASCTTTPNARAPFSRFQAGRLWRSESNSRFERRARARGFGS
jgi:K+ transporter